MMLAHNREIACSMLVLVLHCRAFGNDTLEKIFPAYSVSCGNALLTVEAGVQGVLSVALNVLF